MDTILEKLRDLWWKLRYPFRRTWAFLCAWFSYGRFLWNNYHDWDYAYLLSLLKFKLSRMEKHFRGPNCHIVDGVKVADEIKEAIDLITTIEEAKFVDQEHEEHDKKWGELDIRLGEETPMGHVAIFHRDNAVTEEDKEQETKELLAISELEEQRTQAAYNKLVSQIAERIRCWWD